MQKTVEITINGFTNLGTAIKAAGFTGYNRLFNSPIINENDSTVYIHVTGTGRVAPITGDAAKGIPIGNLVQSTEFVLNNVDAGLTWLYSATSVVVKALLKDG